LRSGTQAQREKEADDQSRELKEVMEGGGMFPNIVLEDSDLDPRQEGKLYNAGDDEEITLKKIPQPNKAYKSTVRWIKIYPEGAFHKDLHLESYYNASNRELHIHTISTEHLQSKGIGTYLFSILFNYLKFHKINFTKISLIFYPTIPDPDRPTERIQTPAVKMRGMEFYYKVFSLYANFYPMIGKEQITNPTKENLQAVIDDYENDDSPSGMVFRRRK
jgi:hypothetical protein